MGTWFLILFSISICLLLQALIRSLLSPFKKLPPGPSIIPIISGFLWLRRLSNLEANLRSLHSKHGPAVTIPLGSRPTVFISDRSIAHKALIQNGAVFSGRPPAQEVGKFLTSNQHDINSASYGPLWRLLRRNLTSEILNSSRVKSYSRARKWVLEILINRLKSQEELGKPVFVIDHFQYAMFCLLVLICFGDKLEEKQIKEIENVQRGFLLSLRRFDILNLWPRLGKILFRKRWEELFQIWNNQKRVLVPLIEARKKAKEEGLRKNDEEFVISYVDTLLDLELPNEKRKLDVDEMISLCSEFLTAGTDTTYTALQWIMANLVKYPEIQKRVYEEIKGVLGESEEKVVREEDLGKLKYLKAVILEGLRRHPPAHFVLPHAVTKDVNFEGFFIPKNVTVNFLVAEMGMDPKVWEDPMAFKPERFLMNGGDEGFDITGSKEIKMMPFGVGRRICPAYGLAILHLEYFVANLVWKFEWNAVDGDDVDLTEKQEFTVVMKKPLQAHVHSRF